MIGVALDLQGWLGLSARVEPEVLRPGETGRLVVEVTIPEGCHVESHAPSEPFLIPTVLTVERLGGVRVGEVEYPPGEDRRFDWSAAVLRIYAGTFALTAPVTVDPDAEPGTRAIAGRLSYQGCTVSICLMPAEQAVAAVFRIATE